MTSHGDSATMAAVFRRPETRDAVMGALAECGALTLHHHMGELDEAMIERLLDEHPDVFFVDMDLSLSPHQSALETLASRRPAGIPIVVTTEQPSMEGMRILLRLDSIDLLPQPIDPAQLMEAIRNGKGKAKPATCGTVVAFLKAGGGVGATTLAVQSACSLGTSSSSQGSAQTCLLDFDVQFGAAALHLDLDHSASLIELPDISERFDLTMLRGAMAHHRCGVDLLPSPSALHPLDMVTPETAITLVHAAAQDFRHILVDLPLTWTAWTRAVLAEANVIILVLRPDVPSIRQARRQIEALASEGCGAIPLKIVANFTPTGLFPAPGIGLKDAARALGRPLDFTIPRADRPFADAVNHGLPLAEVKGGRGPAKQISRMIRSCIR